jgi:glycosyltransferase involved in cell wall biosynthesis
MDLSIIVPLFNEEESVEPLYVAISKALEVVKGDVEIIFVDDGSADGTFKAAEKIAAGDRRLRLIKFRRNFGQTPAMAAGIDSARGKTIVTMDGDLQNDPGDIPNLLSKMEEGYDVVVGWRFDRQDKLISRKVPSVIANWIIGKVTGVPIKDNGCSLKAFRASLIQNVPLYSEMHRFIPALASIAGARIAEIKVRHHARQFGDSKYGLSRTYKVVLDLLMIKSIVGFTARPLMWFATLSIPFFILTFLMLLYSVFSVAAGNQYSLPIAGTGLFFGVLSVFLLFNGALGELVNRMGHVNTINFPLLTAAEIGDSGKQNILIGPAPEVEA